MRSPRLVNKFGYWPGHVDRIRAGIIFLVFWRSGGDPIWVASVRHTQLKMLEDEISDRSSSPATTGNRKFLFVFPLATQRKIKRILFCSVRSVSFHPVPRSSFSAPFFSPCCSSQKGRQSRTTRYIRNAAASPAVCVCVVSTSVLHTHTPTPIPCEFSQGKVQAATRQSA